MKPGLVALRSCHEYRCYFSPTPVESPINGVVIIYCSARDCFVLCAVAVVRTVYCCAANVSRLVCLNWVVFGVRFLLFQPFCQRIERVNFSGQSGQLRRNRKYCKAERQRTPWAGRATNAGIQVSLTHVRRRWTASCFAHLNEACKQPAKSCQLFSSRRLLLTISVPVVAAMAV